MEFVVTTTVKLPVLVGGVVRLTFNWVAVAEATVPIAPLLNATVLLAAVVLNPVPVMTMEAALLARLVVLEITLGATTVIPLPVGSATTTARSAPLAQSSKAAMLYVVAPID